MNEISPVSFIISGIPVCLEQKKSIGMFCKRKLKFLEIHTAVAVMDRFLVKFQALVCIFTEKKSISRVFLWILQSF